MRRNSSRREFLKQIPYSAAGLLSGGMALPGLFGQQPTSPRNPIPVRLPPVHQIQPVSIMRNSFNMITLGDSIMWGQGLPDNPRIPGVNTPSFKFRDLVQDWLQVQFGSSRAVKQWTTHAHSGAKIFVDNGEQDTVTGLPGEIPSGHPSVRMQVDLTASDLIQAGVRLNDVDLVLLDGGINDVNITNVLSPMNGPDTVQSLADQNCIGRMSQLLPYVMGLFSNAAIVITGYFPIASSQSDLSALIAFASALGADMGGPVGAAVGAPAGGLIQDRMVKNSTAWNSEAQNGFLNLVNQYNSNGTASVALAWPNFQPENCYGAPNTFLFTVDQFAGDETNGAANIDPEPPTTPNGVAWTRARACKVADRPSGFCLDASSGHPNPAGAQAYTDAIVSQLETTLRPKLGLPAPIPPKSMTLTIIQNGTEQFPTRSSGNRPETWHWVVVVANDSQSRAPIPGASVFVNSPGGHDLGPANLPYHWYSGPVGQKIYFVCHPQVRPAITQKPTGPEPRGLGPMLTTIPCVLTVAAPGYGIRAISLPNFG